jgi:hypothetical protein
MKEFEVLVHPSPACRRQNSKRINANAGMTFNDFRRRCSEAFDMDVISIFSKSHRRLSDISEIESDKEVFVYDCFYPKRLHNSSTTSSLLPLESEKPVKGLADLEKTRLNLRVETLGPHRAGKTSLIWKFVKNELMSSENFSITEATFEKEIDLAEFTIHFSINDMKENDDLRLFEDRVVDKEVLIFCIAKTDVSESREWILWVLQKARKMNSSALIVLAITKSDVRIGEKFVFDINLLADLDVLVINTSIYENYMSGDVRSSEEVFIAIGEEFIARAKGQPRRTKIYTKSVKQSTRWDKEEEQASNAFWFLRPLDSIKSCFSRRH